MPFETFVIEPGSDILSGDRKHEAVAKDITDVFEAIKERGGQFVTAIALADHTTYAGQGGEPNGATYIVAEFPELNSQTN
jgi:hypothetical protein